MSEPTPASYQTPRKSNRNAIIIALLSVVIVVQAIKIYLDSKRKANDKHRPDLYQTRVSDD